MATVIESRVSTLDHATVPSIDLLADLNFYEKFFGAALLERKAGQRQMQPPMVNFSIARQRQGRAAIFFMEFAGMKGFGLFLQTEYPPAPLRMLEGPRYGLAVADDTLDAAATVLREQGVPFEGPVRQQAESPFAEALYLKDPSDNSLELCTWRSHAQAPRVTVRRQGLIPLAGVCQAALDVTDLDRAEEFYVKGIGFQPLYRGTCDDGLPKGVLRMNSGQILALQQVEAMSERSIKKYRSDAHVAFTVADGGWPVIKREMDERGVELLPDYVAGDGLRPADYENVYVKDPFGNNVQIFTPMDKAA